MSLKEELALIVENAAKRDSNIFGYEIWQHHVVHVIKYSKILAKEIGADEDIVEIAAILHDYASIKDASLYPEHHLHGAAEAELLLKDFGYPADRIEMVKHCIIAHRGSVTVERLTKEAACVASADAIAHIIDLPSMFHLAYVRHGLGVEAGKKWILSKLQRSWAKLSPEARTLISHDYAIALGILVDNRLDDIKEKGSS